MNDEQMQQVVGSWLNEGDPEPPDARTSVHQAMARMPQVRQRGRWWPLPVLRRTPQPPTATGTTDYQPSPIPATNGHAPIVIGRTYTMFSPVKAIVAGALVFALGGMFLIAQPFSQQGSVPGAEQGPEPGTGVVITVTHPAGFDGYEPDAVRDPAGYWVIDGAVDHGTWDATDPRLSGAVTYIGMRRSYSLQSTELEAVAVTVYGDEGRWVGAGRGIYSPYGEYGDSLWLILEGEDEYEDLTAYVTFDVANEDGTGRGFIIEGGLPPFPEPAE